MRPEDVPEEIVEIAAKAVCRAGADECGGDVCRVYGPLQQCTCWGGASVAIAAVYPLIRAAVVEECAKAAEAHSDAMWRIGGPVAGIASAVAAIRALENQP